MLVGVVDNRLHRVEPQPVDMKIADPVSRVVGHEITNRPAPRPVKVHRIAPLSVMLFTEIMLRKLRGVVAARSQMVVDAVENYTHSKFMRPLNERAHVVWGSIELRRRKPVDPVVTPTELPR